MNELDTIFGLDGGSPGPSSSSNALPLSTVADTSGGNGNSSGTSLLSYLNGITGLGSTALNAYNTIMGKPATTAAAKPATAAATPAASFMAYLPWILTGGGVLLLIVLLTRSTRR